MHREHKMDFHIIAADLQEERTVRLATRMSTEQGRLQKLRQQLRDECLRPSGSPLRLGSCRFSACQQVDFEAMLSAKLWSRAHLAELRQKANEPIQQPIDPIKATLDSMKIPMTTASEAVPDWARWMAHHRDFFRSCVVRMKLGEERRHYRFIFALQPPTLVCLCRLQVEEVAEAAFDASSFAAAGLDIWDHTFLLDGMDFEFSDDTGLVGCSDIEVLANVATRPQNRIVGDGDFRSMDDMLASLPAPKGRVGGGRGGEKREEATELPPWMTESSLLDFVRDEQKAVGEKKVGGGKARRRPPQHDSDDEEAAADTSDAALQALWERRLDLEADRAAFPEAFNYVLRGGAWTAAHAGVAYDSYRAQAAGREAAHFCQQWALPKSATFSIRKFGEESCLQLCRYWCHRLAFWHQLWCAAGGEEAFAFQAEDVRFYEEPPEAAILLASEDAFVRQRAQEIPGIRPRFGRV